MGRAIPFAHFSTSGFAPTDQFDAWHDKVSVIFDVEPVGGSRPAKFEAEVRAYQLGNLVITESAQGEQAYSLTPKRLRSTSIDLFQIGLYRSGGYIGDANGTAIEGKSGDLQVLDLGRPMHSIEAASNMVCVFLPRETLQEKIGDLDGLHGLNLHSSTGALLADYLAMLANRLPLMEESESEAAADMTVEMISACLRATPIRGHDVQSPIQDVVLRRAKRLIEANLASSRLTTEFLCQTLGVSRRSLYRLFEPLGGVHQYILGQRLHQIATALSDPAEHRRIADLAAMYGFSCHETFWRAFKRRYGVTPADVRAVSAAPNGVKLPVAGQGFEDWLKRLHA